MQAPQSTIIVPASTSNLGASFDTCGLALAIYLQVKVEPLRAGFEIEITGEGADKLPRDESNLIIRAAMSAAEWRGREITGARLLISNQIPVSRGLGSSSAAILAGISVYEALSGERLSREEFLDYALRFEGHGDNLGPSELGGLFRCHVGAHLSGGRQPPVHERQLPGGEHQRPGSKGGDVGRQRRGGSRQV